MDGAAEEALYIGVNVLIFVAAITCAIMLMTSVLNMTQAMNNILDDSADSALMELYGGTAERIYYGQEVLTLVEEYNSKASGIRDKMVIAINSYGSNRVIGDNFTLTKDELRKTYNIVYSGLDENNKKVYVFKAVSI